jgi:hypothetical protein
LERGGANLVFGHRRLEVEKRFDASTHKLPRLIVRASSAQEII